jgi:hypothetical protein
VTRRALASVAVLVGVVSCSGSDVVLYRVARDAALTARIDAGDASSTVEDASSSADGAAQDAGTGGAAAGGVASGGIAGQGGQGGRAGGGSGGTGGAGGVVGIGGAGICADTTDCANGWTCEKRDCTAPTGLCVARPIVCDNATLLPVCGCDHLTYWNDCVRQQHGISAGTFGQCGPGAIACDVASDCGKPEASCAHVIPTTLPCSSTPSPGTCWVLPPDCTGTPPSPQWHLCSSPGLPLTCADTCTAIRSGLSYVTVSAGPACP